MWRRLQIAARNFDHVSKQNLNFINIQQLRSFKASSLAQALSSSQTVTQGQARLGLHLASLSFEFGACCLISSVQPLEDPSAGGLIDTHLLHLTGMNASPTILINAGALRSVGKLPVNMHQFM
jgi:hypothetical protein